MCEGCCGCLRVVSLSNFIIVVTLWWLYLVRNNYIFGANSQIRVVDIGGSDSGFMAYWVFYYENEPHTVGQIFIAEYAEQENKPFIVSWSNDIYTGTCK